MPLKGNATNIKHEAFTSKRIVLLGGIEIDPLELDKFARNKDLNEILEWVRSI